MTVCCPGWKKIINIYIYIYLYLFDRHTSITNVIYNEVRIFGVAMFMQKDKNVYLNFSLYAKN